MKACTYAWLAGACLLLLSGAELVGVLSFFGLATVVFVAATGALLLWEGGLRRNHCKLVVGAVGALYLLGGMVASAWALLREESVTRYGVGVDVYFAVVFGLLSLFAAVVLTEAAAPSDGNAR